MKSECPILNKLKKKAMVITWDDSDKKSTYEEQLYELSNLTFIAIGDELFNELDEGSKKKWNKRYLIVDA